MPEKITSAVNAYQAKIIACFALLLGICFNYLFYDRALGIGFPIFIFLLLGGLVFFSIRFHKTLHEKVFWLFIPIGFLSSMVLIRASDILTFLNVATVIFLLLIITKISLSKNIDALAIALSRMTVLLLPLQFIIQFFHAIPNVLTLENHEKASETARHILRGIVITIPVLLVFYLFFSSADTIFQTFFRNFFSFNISEETVIRVVWTLIVTILLLGSFAYTFQENTLEVTRSSEKKKFMGNIELFMLFGSVNLLFLFFIFIQLTYFFGGENSMAALNLTYSEYAKKGFYELVLAAATSFLLIRFAHKRSDQADNRKKSILEWFFVALILQTTVIMVSAFMRLSLYEQAYGFTNTRFYGHAVIIFLAFAFLLLLINILKRNQTEQSFIFRIFILALLSLATFNILSPEAFVAKKNIELYKSTGTIDIDYLSSLSTDAIPEIAPFLNDLKDEDMKKIISNRWWHEWEYMQSPKVSGWPSFHLSRLQAWKILKNERGTINRYRDRYEKGEPAWDDRPFDESTMD